MIYAFIKRASLLAATAAIAVGMGTGDADAKKVRGKIHQAYGQNIAVIGPPGHRIADAVRRMSGGDFDIKVFEPGALAGGFA